MDISGLQKLTLLDFPGHVACTVFLSGCNFRCPYCYNSSLIVNDNNNFMKEDVFFTFLASRKGKLDGVAITGGEPLLRKDIVNFIRKIKGFGFMVKLDTNGSCPEKLQELLDENLLDYVAMDFKNTYDKYNLTTGVMVDIDKIKQSVDLLLNSSIDYEFRTTLVKNYHTLEDLDNMSKTISKAKNYFLQCFQFKDSVLDKNLQPFDKKELEICLEVVRKNIKNASLRGIG